MELCHWKEIHGRGMRGYGEILRAIEKWTCGKREDKPLTHLRPNSGMGEEEEREKQKGGI